MILACMHVINILRLKCTPTAVAVQLLNLMMFLGVFTFHRPSCHTDVKALQTLPNTHTHIHTSICIVLGLMPYMKV